jgi:hypothetical protein
MLAAVLAVAQVRLLISPRFFGYSRTRKARMYIERYISLTALLVITGVDGTSGAFAESRRCLVKKIIVAFGRPVWRWLNEPTYPTSKLAGLRWVERARNYGPGK